MTTRRPLVLVGGVSAEIPSGDTIPAAVVPTLNQSTTGSAATLTTSHNFSIGGSGITAGPYSFNGSADVVLSATVDPGHITLARMADIATARFIGRVTAGTGVPEALTVSQVKTALDLTGTNSGDQTTIVGITGTKAQFNAAVTGDNLLFDSDINSTVQGFTTTTLQFSALDTGAPSDDVIVFWDFSAGAFDWLTLGPGLSIAGTILSISSGSLTLADGDYGDVTVASSGSSITIDAGAVTLAKMADIPSTGIIYRKTAGTGVPEVNTLATLKTDLGLTGTNSGDQTSIVGITGTKAQFDTAVSDGNIVYTDAIGVSVQAYDADLATIAGLTATTDNFIVSVSSAWASRTPAQVRTTLGLVIGTDVQAYDADLTTLGAGGSGARTFLGLGTSAVIDTGTSGTKVALTDGANSWSGAQSFINSSGIKIQDTDASHTLGLIGGSNLTANRTLTITTGDASRVLTFTGDASISGTNTGDQTTVTGNAGTATALQSARTIDGQSFDGTANITVIAPGTHAATSKATPVDADELPLVDSAASNVLKRLTWANLKATLKAYFDTLYQAVTGAWTTYTPTVTAGSGTFTTVSATGRWVQIGKAVHFWVRITITTNGTAAAYVRFTLPTSTRNVDATAFQHIVGRQSASGGNIVIGQINDNANTCDLLTYNNLYPGASGEKLTVSGTYETA